MKQIIHRLYLNPQKEENWLNSLAAKGLSLSDHSLARYVFQDTEPGEYTYRIEFLREFSGAVESKAYLHFLEETGVEVVTFYRRLAYLRKKKADGPFDLYSDIASRMRYYKRFTRTVLLTSITFLFAGLVNIQIGISNLFADTMQEVGFDRSLDFASLILGIFAFCLGICQFFAVYRPIRSQLRKLKKKKGIFE